MIRRRLVTGWAVVSSVLCLAAATAAAGQQGDDIHVASLAFEGNQAFDDGQLRAVVVTRASGRWPWSERRFFNRSVFDRDLDRLRAFYADRGFPDARITGVDVDFTSARDGVRLRVHIEEGEPLIVDRVETTGFDSAPNAVIDALTDLPIAAGMRRDRERVSATRERLTFLLRDNGYPAARVESEERPAPDPGRVIVTFTGALGPAAVFGPISVEGERSVASSVIVRSLSFRPGQMYRESLVLESQRRLGALGIFDFAHVAPVPEAEPSAASGLPMRVTVAEGKAQRYQIGIGYGSEDGPRGSFKWEHLNFLGDARRFAFDSQYSARLRGAGIEFTEPYFLTRRMSVNARVGAWWAVEPVYTSRAIGGRVGVTWRAEHRASDLRPVSHTVRAGYLNDSLVYTIDEAVLADLTRVDELIALGLDPVTGRGRGRLTALTADFERAVGEFEGDPHSGYAATVHLKHAAPWLGGTFRYSEVLAEGRLYVPLGSRAVWASRVRAGSIFARAATDVPFSQRYFLGGSSTLRGWGRYQVAPLTAGGLPIGGRTLVDLSTELRLPVRGPIGVVAFVDAGNAWDESGRVRLNDLQVSAGPGLRYSSPIGVVRADLGIQFTRVPGLLVNGKPESRRWRVHLSIGHAF